MSNTAMSNRGSKSSDDDKPSQLGRVIREERTKRGLGLRDLSERSGVDSSIISRLETGNQIAVRRNNYIKLAAAFGYSYDELRALAGEIPDRPSQPHLTFEDVLRMEGLLSEDQIDILVAMHDDMARRVGRD